MEMKAVVPYQGALVHYSLSPDSHGIYNARLIKCVGQPKSSPPEAVILVRGYRRWTGSFDRQELIDELGDAIDQRVTSRTLPRNTDPASGA